MAANLYLSSVSSFVSSLAGVSGVSVWWFNGNGYSSMNFGPNELEDISEASKVFDQLAAEKLDPEMYIYAESNWKIRYSDEKGAYCRPRD